MSDGCQRCGWPYGKTAESGCTPGNCQCVCPQYPACACGSFDKEKPEVAITVPRGTVMATSPAAQAPAASYAGPIAPPAVRSTDPHMVVLHQPSGSRAKIIYIGNDKGKAFDAVMGMAVDALLSEITVESEKTD